MIITLKYIFFFVLDIKEIDVGDIHHGSVVQLNELGAICNLDNGVKAIATKDHLAGQAPFCYNIAHFIRSASHSYNTLLVQKE